MIEYNPGDRIRIIGGGPSPWTPALKFLVGKQTTIDHITKYGGVYCTNGFFFPREAIEPATDSEVDTLCDMFERLYDVVVVEAQRRSMRLKRQEVEDAEAN